MPYIEQHQRPDLDEHLNRLPPDLDAGSLTYCLYRLMLRKAKKNFRFVTVALVIGCAVCAVLEFYRHVVAPYEDTKITANGDVTE